MKARFLYRAYKARLRDQRQEILAAITCLRPGDLAVDVGANKGAYLYWLRRAVGPTGRVHAYEPQPRLARYLKDISARLHWENVVVHDCALSDSAGVKTLHVPGQGDSPSASLEDAITHDAMCQTYDCPVDTLDHQLAGAGPPAFLKIDVEGHELSVFRGATEILTRSSPIILFECESRHLQTHTMEDVFAFLQKLGYGGSFFCEGRLLPLTKFSPALHQKRGSERFWDAPDYCNNFLFRRPG